VGREPNTAVGSADDALIKRSTASSPARHSAGSKPNPDQEPASLKCFLHGTCQPKQRSPPVAAPLTVGPTTIPWEEETGADPNCGVWSLPVWDLAGCKLASLAMIGMVLFREIHGSRVSSGEDGSRLSNEDADVIPRPAWNPPPARWSAILAKIQHCWQ
jgi:hypothetical protein